MRVEQGEFEGIPVIRLHGRLDFAGAQEIRDAFLHFATVAPGPVIVDLGGVEWMASVAIRLILEGAKLLTGRGFKLVLYNAQERVDKSLRASGLHICMDMASDPASAAQAARTPGTRMA